ncbi:SGNH/GDSL hydrolase family protein [Mesorhizobium caraganae]|uniref:SGNH/GDSL hydrolase family protein n=1 Tax=Mesorhizobium caraganae TaxID=483206 RepID=UPI003ECE6171
MKSVVARIGMMIGSLAVTFGLVEAAVRWVDGGGLPSLPIFRQIDDGPIDLQDNAVARYRSTGRHVHTVMTGSFGLRIASPGEAAPSPGEWLAVGDSQVFGLGVEGAETFTALARSKGVRIANAGVPGYGIEDALARAEILLPLLKPKGVILLVNQANDWEEIGTPAQLRFRVRGSWLLQRIDSDAWEGRFMATPLSRLHTLFYTAKFIHVIVNRGSGFTEAPGWITRPAEQETMTLKMAQVISDFTRRHGDVEVVVCFLPVDFATGQERAEVSPFRSLIGDLRPWENHDLRDQLLRALPGVPVVDLLPALSNDPRFFLDGDYHLSPAGHEVVSAALVQTIQNPEKAR